MVNAILFCSCICLFETETRLFLDAAQIHDFADSEAFPACGPAQIGDPGCHDQVDLSWEIHSGAKDHLDLNPGLCWASLGLLFRLFLDPFPVYEVVDS